MTPEERRMMMEMERLQQMRAPNAAVAALNTPEALAQQERFRAGMQEAMQPRPQVGPAPGSRPPNPFVRGLSQLGRRFMDVAQDPVAMAQLAQGFNTLRFRPDQQLAQGLQQRIQTVQSQRQQAQEANMTAEYLRNQGRSDLATIIEANPSMANDILAQLFTTRDTFATKGFAPQVDPQTGQLYGVQYDPNSGKYTRVDVAGAVGETPSEVLSRETETELEVMDRERAMKAGQDAFVAAERATGTIDTLNRALDSLEAGGESGFIQSYLPSFNAATTTLRQAATEMGIDLIQSATFGALSESELRLALSSTIDLNLPPAELRALLQDKIRVQKILRDELMKKARELSGGKVKYSDHIQRYQIQGGVEPTSVIQVRPEDL
jgi:hypothetical protein